MNAIKKLTKLTLTELKNKGLPSTPENYFLEFYKQCKQQELILEEHERFEEIKSKVNSETLNKQEINTYFDLIELLLNRPSLNDLSKFTQNIDEILSPSIDFSNDQKINDFTIELAKEPTRLLERESIDKLKNLTKDRIKADREVLTKKTSDIIKLSSLMGKYFDKTLLESTNSSDEIHKIKDELEELNISNASQRELGVLQQKLVDTVYNIEKNMEINKNELSESKEKFEKLNTQIVKLQEELELAKKEKSTDFLTGVLNRRALSEELEKVERKHTIFKTNYAIVFYDIDHFKAINDEHGHICGDAILRTFGGVLKRLTRKEDVIARYGGEEFIALINYDDEKELIKYAKRVKKLINESDFIYKDVNIDLKYSAGISFRNKYDSYEEAKKRADELLYQAKHEGRDMVLFDNGMKI